jgi:ABC-type dipeptide/oligopeptide/nickel transport system permease component
MGSLLGNVVPIIVLVLLAAAVVWIGVRLGVRFLVRRVAGLVFVLLGVTFITFILGYFAPGNAVVTQLGVRYTPELAKGLLHFYGLDLPWYQQYGNFLSRLIHFDLGFSYLDRSQTVWEIINRELPISVQLGIGALVLSLIIGVPMGMLGAVRANTRYDTSIQGVALILYSLPSFVLIPFYDILMIYLNNKNLPNLPVSSTDWTTTPIEWVAPTVIFAAITFAYFVRITRTSMLEVLHQDYVRTARAKGLKERTVLWKHAFRNALIPLVTVIGPSLAFVVNGAFIIENLFNVPGIGSQTISSITNRDFPVVEATVILLAVSVAAMNLATDIVYGLIDPRIEVV